MFALDSRMLSPVNTFVQKVVDPGEVIVEACLSAGGFTPLDEKRAQRVKIKSKRISEARLRTTGKRHLVPVEFKNGDFTIATIPEAFEQGDALLFHATDRKAPAFCVRGRIGDRTFASNELRDQAVYTHAFGLPGRFEWTDANGSGAGGVIVVKNEPGDGKEAAERAMKRMSEGVLIHIIGNKVSPKEVQISTGQTVFFAVEDSKGMTITDVSLLGKR